MSATPTDPFALTRVVVARADYLIETSLRRAGFAMTLGELRVLQLVAQGAQTPGAIRRAMGDVTQQYVSKCLTRLHGQGCIERLDDATDRRRVGVDLTQEGRRAIALCNAWFDRFEELAPTAYEASAETILRGFDDLVDARGTVLSDLPTSTP